VTPASQFFTVADRKMLLQLKVLHPERRWRQLAKLGPKRVLFQTVLNYHHERQLLLLQSLRLPADKTPRQVETALSAAIVLSSGPP
jgi:hypothetical protein